MRGIGRDCLSGTESQRTGASSFLANDRVSEAESLADHFQAACDRMAPTDGPILVLHISSLGNLAPIAYTARIAAVAQQAEALRSIEASFACCITGPDRSKRQTESTCG
jgi:hypothetical protein